MEDSYSHTTDGKLSAGQVNDNERTKEKKIKSDKHNKLSMTTTSIHSKSSKTQQKAPASAASAAGGKSNLGKLSQQSKKQKLQDVQQAVQQAPTAQKNLFPDDVGFTKNKNTSSSKSLSISTSKSSSSSSSSSSLSQPAKIQQVKNKQSLQLQSQDKSRDNREDLQEKNDDCSMEDEPVEHMEHMEQDQDSMIVGSDDEKDGPDGPGAQGSQELQGPLLTDKRGTKRKRNSDVSEEDLVAIAMSLDDDEHEQSDSPHLSQHLPHHSSEHSSEYSSEPKQQPFYQSDVKQEQKQEISYGQEDRDNQESKDHSKGHEGKDKGKKEKNKEKKEEKEKEKEKEKKDKFLARKINIINTYDGKKTTYETTGSALRHSALARAILTVETETELPLTLYPQVVEDILAWGKIHAEDKEPKLYTRFVNADLTSYVENKADIEFLKSLDEGDGNLREPNKRIIDLLTASHYLQIQPLQLLVALKFNWLLMNRDDNLASFR